MAGLGTDCPGPAGSARSQVFVTATADRDQPGLAFVYSVVTMLFHREPVVQSISSLPEAPRRLRGRTSGRGTGHRGGAPPYARRLAAPSRTTAPAGFRLGCDAVLGAIDAFERSRRSLGRRANWMFCCSSSANSSETLLYSPAGLKRLSTAVARAHGKACERLAARLPAAKLERLAD